MIKKSAIYILDGMGSQAGGYLYNTLINKAVSDYGAKNNDDFPEIILHSIPVPDFISDNKNRNRALFMLKQRTIQITNASCISIACNTAHILLPKLQKVSKTPFVSMIDETVEQVHKDGNKIVGILGTPSTLKYGLYQNALSEYGISNVIPSKRQIDILEKIIRNVLKGKILISDSKNLEKIAEDLKSRGAEVIILGCTELPLLFPPKYSLPVYDSVEILAETLLQKYYKQNTIRP